jgi:hypothetical protein
MENQSWDTPKVIGFMSHPQMCSEFEIFATYYGFVPGVLVNGYKGLYHYRRGVWEEDTRISIDERYFGPQPYKITDRYLMLKSPGEDPSILYIYNRYSKALVTSFTIDRYVGRRDGDISYGDGSDVKIYSFADDGNWTGIGYNEALLVNGVSTGRQANAVKYANGKVYALHAKDTVGHDDGFDAVYEMDRDGNIIASHSIDSCIHQTGVSSHIIFDANKLCFYIVGTSKLHTYRNLTVEKYDIGWIRQYTRVFGAQEIPYTSNYLPWFDGDPVDGTTVAYGITLGSFIVDDDRLYLVRYNAIKDTDWEVMPNYGPSYAPKDIVSTDLTIERSTTYAESAWFDYAFESPVGDMTPTYFAYAPDRRLEGVYLEAMSSVGAAYND